MKSATKQVEAYATRIGGVMNAPVFAVKHDTEFLDNPRAVAFDVYMGTEHVCRMTLEGGKWTARNRSGRKISRRKGAWWKAATVACEKKRDAMRDAGTYRDCYSAHMGARTLEVAPVS